MKKIHWIQTLATAAVVCLTWTSCGERPAANAYRITGVIGGDTIPGLEAIYLSGTDGEILATDSLISEGTFTFDGVVDSTTTMARIVADRRHSVLVFLEPGELRVDLTRRVAEGTPLNDEYTAFVTAVREAPESIDGDSLAGVLAREVYLRHTNDDLGYMMFHEMAYTLSYDELSSMLAEANDRIKSSEYFQKMLEAKQAEQATAPGTTYIDVRGMNARAAQQEGKELIGDSLALSDLVGGGKPTLVDFWASWCGPCRAEIPYIAAAAQQYAGKVNVVGIAVWDRLSDTQRAMQELGISWPVIFSERGTEAYGIQGIPHIMLIAADGTILARNLRGEGIALAIESALKQ